MDRSSKLLMAVGIGVTVTVSSAAAYYVFKRYKDDEHLIDQIDGNAGRTSNYDVRCIRVADKYVGAIVGRESDVIKRIQLSTKTRINVNDDLLVYVDDIVNLGEDGSDAGKSVYLMIRGSESGIQEAEKQIRRIIANQPLIFSDNVLVPLPVARSLAGDVIKSISRETEAEIVIDDETKRDDGNVVMVMRGTSEQIIASKAIVLEKIADYESECAKSGHPVHVARNLAIDYNSTTVNVSSASMEAMFDRFDSTSNGRIDVYVSTFKSISQFWVQMVGTRSVKLDKLLDDMTDFYEIDDNLKASRVKDVRIGDILAAPFEHDNFWYRVQVTEIGPEGYSPDETDVTVFYLDFGDYSVLPKNQLCRLGSSYITSFPFQAIECQLAGVKPPNDVTEWTQEANRHFTEITHSGQWKKVTASLVKQIPAKCVSGHICLVDLFDIDTDVAVNIAESLIERGHAVNESTE